MKYYIHNPNVQDVADGFVPKIDDWEKEIDWADVIIFDDVLGQGKKAKQLRDKGKCVIGGTEYTDQLEDDRTFGQEELRKAGVNIIPFQEFTSFDDAIGYVQANPNRYVIKPSGAVSKSAQEKIVKAGGRIEIFDNSVSQLKQPKETQ